MASFRKLLARPRLQLLVLMLVLVAGLFPGKTLADEEAPAASPADGSEGAPAAPAPTDASGSPNGTAVGRADKVLKCYVMQCDGTRDKCLKTLGVEVECDGGEYCAHFVFDVYDKDEVSVRRGCATAAQFDCVDKGCVFADSKTSLDSDHKDYEEKSKCFDDAERKRGSSGRQSGSGSGSGNGNSASYNAFGRLVEARQGKSVAKIALCGCNTDLCNDRKSSGPTGVKQLGFNVALVGALLVSVFPLRSLFLVG